jgi:hypothetical protein
MLFDGWPDPEPPPEVNLTPAQKLRARQESDIAAGRHPLNGLPLKPWGTCGTCGHRYLHRANKAWPKCDLETTTPPRPTRTHGSATDVKASWPACVGWTPKENQ